MLKKCKLFGIVTFIFFLASCNNSKNEDKETILKGNISLVTDESILPIVEDELIIFQDRYDAKIEIISKSEAELVKDLVSQKYKVAFMTRSLSEEEKAVFEQKKIIPRITPFAKDAVTLIANNAVNDTLVDLKEVVAVLQGNVSAKVKGLVFDNPNSSTARQLMELANVDGFPKERVYSFDSNEEVFKFVAENEGMIGVVGYNWITQPNPKVEGYLSEIVVLSVKGIGQKDYFMPSQYNLANNLYPLARDLYIVNCQGTAGLGMGIASFVAGEIGQRIVLKSELLPHHTPGRKVLVRGEIVKEKKK